MRSVGLVLAALLASASAFAEPALLEFRGAGICNASAVVALDDRRILVGDDEESVLPMFDVATQRLLGTTVFGGKEADVEGGAILQGRVVWIGSHGRNSRGKPRPERQQLFVSHRVAADGSAVASLSPPFTGLLRAIAAKASDGPIYRQIAASLGPAGPDAEFAPKRAGFNIEGLTTTEGLSPAPSMPGLLIGLRNPAAPDGRAILFELTNAIPLLDGRGTEAELGRTFLLDLGGRRIRDISYSPLAQSYFIIGGPVGDAAAAPPGGGSAFAVFRWDGKAGTPPVPVEGFGDLDKLDDFRAEAIVALPARSPDGLRVSYRLLLLSDDGKRMIGGVHCEELPAAQQFFRGLITPG